MSVKSTANRARIVVRNGTPESTQHFYDSGVYHDTFPGDAIGCCDKHESDPIHVEKPPTKVCSCDSLTFRHLWSRDRCPRIPVPDMTEPKSRDD